MTSRLPWPPPPTSHTVTLGRPLPPVERDVFYGRPLSYFTTRRFGRIREHEIRIFDGEGDADLWVKQLKKYVVLWVKSCFWLTIFLRNGVLDNFSWGTFSQRYIKMKNNCENHTSMRFRNRSKITFKVALSCWFPFQNTVPCCRVKTVPKHQPSRRRGLR